MGFFSELKEDFSQAVNELGDLGKIEDELPAISEEEAAIEEFENNTMKSDDKEENVMGIFDDGNVDKDLLDQILAGGNEEEAEMDDVLEAALNQEEPAEEKKEKKEKADKKEDKAKKEDKEEKEEEKEEKKESKAVPKMPDADAIENSDIREEARKQMEEERANGTVTVITKGTIINGGISSDGSLEVMGTITGDVECLGKLSIIGKVSGNAIASEIFVNTSRLEGNLSSEGTVKIGVGTIVVGDIVGSSAVIAGAIKGDIDINGPVVVDSTAIVRGNIKAKSIQVNNGAVVDGYCSLNYADVDLESFFDAE